MTMPIIFLIYSARACINNRPPDITVHSEPAKSGYTFRVGGGGGCSQKKCAFVSVLFVLILSINVDFNSPYSNQYGKPLGSQSHLKRHQVEMTLRRNMLLYFNVQFDASPS